MPAYDVSQLLNMSAADLDALFAKSPAGPIPNGPANGTAIVDSGKPVSKEIAWLVHHFAWQGKTFDAAHGTLRNRITRAASSSALRFATWSRRTSTRVPTAGRGRRSSKC